MSIQTNNLNLDSIFQSFSDLVIVIQKEGEQIIEVSNSAIQHIGYEPEELKGKDFKLIIRKSAINQLRDKLNTFGADESSTFIIEIQDKSLNYIPFEIAINPISKEPGVFIAVCRNISKRISSTQKESHYRNQLITLSETAIDFLGVSVNQDIYKYIGQKLHDLFSDYHIIVFKCSELSNTIEINHLYGVENSILSKINKLLGYDFKKRKFDFNPAFLEIIKSRNFVSRTIEEYSKDIDFIPTELALQVFKLLNIHNIHTIGLSYKERVYGAIEIFVNKNDSFEYQYLLEAYIRQAAVAFHRQEKEKELIFSREKAIESEKIKTSFLANISHEIRTPMNAILGFSQLLKYSNLPEDKRNNYVNVITEKGNDLLNLLNDLIDISLIESKSLNPSPKNFELNSLLDDLYAFYSSKLKPDILLSVEKALADENSMVYMDSSRIKQILTNLLNNAVKFTQEGFILFGYEIIENKNILFFVKDSGPGIKKEKQEIIFERFTQSEDDNKQTSSGSGLGLAIAREVASVLRGNIWVESEFGKGSAFFLSLPYTESFDTINKNDNDMQLGFNLENKKVLIAEDDETNYEYLQIALEELKANVIWAKNGIEAIKMYESENPDLILMDIKMPKLNGLEAIDHIRKKNKNVPIIAQTAYTMESDKEKSLQLGANAYLTKPISKNKLFDLIKDLIN